MAVLAVVVLPSMISVTQAAHHHTTTGESRGMLGILQLRTQADRIQGCTSLLLPRETVDNFCRVILLKPLSLASGLTSRGPRVMVLQAVRPDKHRLVSCFQVRKSLAIMMAPATKMRKTTMTRTYSSQSSPKRHLLRPIHSLTSLHSRRRNSIGRVEK